MADSDRAADGGAWSGDRPAEESGMSDAGGARDRWHDRTRALVGGVVVASVLFFALVAVQTPGLEPPPESAALFVLVTALGVVSYLFLRDGDPVGYPATMLTGVAVLALLAVVAGGTYGSAGPRTNPVGPVTYAALAVGAMVAAGLAWRRESTAEAGTLSSTP